MAVATPDGVPLDPLHDRPHVGAAVEEWVFTAWVPDASFGVVSAHRIAHHHAWYWSAVVGVGRRVVHVAEWDVPMRAAAPDVFKAHGLWAEHICEAPMVQWTVANECFATELSDPADALDRAYGTPIPLAIDLEWYATAPPRPTTAPGETGFQQDGVVHGVIDGAGGSRRNLAEVPARRWRRWGEALGPLKIPDAYAHTGARVVFGFPDATVVDWVLTPDGFRSRLTSRRC